MIEESCRLEGRNKVHFELEVEVEVGKRKDREEVSPIRKQRYHQLELIGSIRIRIQEVQSSDTEGTKDSSIDARLENSSNEGDAKEVGRG